MSLRTDQELPCAEHSQFQPALQGTHCRSQVSPYGNITGQKYRVGAGGRTEKEGCEEQWERRKKRKEQKVRTVGIIPHWIRNVAKGTVAHGATRSSIGKQPSTDYSLASHPVPP